MSKTTASPRSPHPYRRFRSTRELPKGNVRPVQDDREETLRAVERARWEREGVLLEHVQGKHGPIETWDVQILEELALKSLLGPWRTAGYVRDLVACNTVVSDWGALRAKSYKHYRRFYFSAIQRGYPIRGTVIAARAKDVVRWLEKEVGAEKGWSIVSDDVLSLR